MTYPREQLGVPSTHGGQLPPGGYQVPYAQPGYHYAAPGGMPWVPQPPPVRARRKWPWIVGGVVAFLCVAGSGVLTVVVKVGQQVNANSLAAEADRSALSDVRGAISTVEQYYTDNGEKYPPVAASAYNVDNTMPEVELGSVYSDDIELTTDTRLYYIPVSYASGYRICATNTAGSGKWFAYDSVRGGSVTAISRPLDPATCDFTA